MDWALSPCRVEVRKKNKKPPIEANLNRNGNIRLSITFECAFPFTCPSLLARTKEAIESFGIWNRMIESCSLQLKYSNFCLLFFFLRRKKKFRNIDELKLKKEHISIKECQISYKGNPFQLSVWLFRKWMKNKTRQKKKKKKEKPISIDN